MTGFGLTPLYRPSLGFDRLASFFDTVDQPGQKYSIPAYDIEEIDSHRYQLSLSVPGYSEKDLEIEATGNYLKIRGEARLESENRKYIHKGIERRKFEQSFQLGENINVTGSALQDGILTVDFERLVPETEKTRKIPIRRGK